MKKKYFILFLIFSLILCALIFSVTSVSADDLTDNIDEQLNNIDLSVIDDYINGLGIDVNGESFIETVSKILSGEYDTDYGSLLNYVFNNFFNRIYQMLPTFVSVIAIAIFCGIIYAIKGVFLSDGIEEIIFFVCFASSVALIFTQFTALYTETENTIKILSKICEIMSPIILSLMVAGGGSASVAMYKPVVSFLSNGIIYVVLYGVMPLITVYAVFAIISKFSKSIKLEKFMELSSSVIKWLLGISVTVFSVFMSVQGISSACYDGVSVKAAKYAINNSVPIIGSFLGSGFDLVIAGSVLIKNAVGVAAVGIMFYIVISPFITLVAFNLMLKLTAALTESITDQRISNFCTSISKGISFLIAALLAVGFMMFVTILLLIFSANAFI